MVFSGDRKKLGGAVKLFSLRNKTVSSAVEMAREEREPRAKKERDETAQAQENLFVAAHETARK